MELVSNFKQSFNNWFGLFADKTPKKVGVYGPPNAGKCVHPDEKILVFENGERKEVKIEELFNKFIDEESESQINHSGFETVVSPESSIEVKSVTDGGAIENCSISKLYRQRYAGQLYRVTTQEQETIRVSPEHPLLTDVESLEYTSARDVSEGDVIGCTYEAGSREHGKNLVHVDSINETQIECVETVPYIGYIYDITVPETRNFTSANGVVLHNTTLTNNIVEDWSEMDDVNLQSTSEVPHETRSANQESVDIEHNDTTVSFSIVDTPGLDTEVDYEEFVEHGINEDEAIERSREATEGIAEAMHWLKEDIDGVIYMMDSTKDPFTQVNTMTTGIIESKDVPAVVLANKTDLNDANVKRIRKAYPQHDVVPVSALEGANMDTVYEKLAEKFG